MKEENILFAIQGKTVVVTGATGILCGAMAEFLAAQGANVVLVGRNEEKGRQLEAKIQETGGKAVFVAADVMNQGDIERVRDTALETYGTIDILVNGAGGNRPGASTSDTQTFFDLPLDDIGGVLSLNLLGSILPSQILGNVMAEKKEGVIINISSMAAQQPATKVLGYSAAKAGVDNFTRWLAVHMAQEYSPSIRVNAIAPGFFLTQQNHYLLVDKDTGGMTARGQKIIDNTPMGRYGDPEDLLGCLLWLISDGAKFVTGAVIPVDGGFSAYSGV